MLEIKPIQDKETQEQICYLCGAEYDAEALAYSAYVDGVLNGVAQFILKDGVCTVKDIANAKGVSDEEALFIMARGMLNYVDLVGIHDAFLAEPQKIDDRLRAWIGFRPDENGRYYMNLRGFFDGKHDHNC